MCPYNRWKRRQGQRSPCEDGSIDRNDAAINQGTPEALWLELPGRGKERLFPRAFERRAALLTP